MEHRTAAARQGSILVMEQPVSGIPLGTEIATADGILPIEHLTLGDRVITREYGMQSLTWVGHRYVTCDAVRLSENALGNGRPAQRMFLPSGQRVLVRDWRAKTLYNTRTAGVRAQRLVDGTYVRDVGARNLRLFYLGFERSCTVYAGGFEMLSHVPSDMPRIPAHFSLKA
ncbi:Hint domain-containing protein [Shimia ponticola]|uniref:Hint domain-containing protein n=1 Tax=Shimia ponticola TaxID=2582893 RepID=UPI0011BD78A8|nr:Hint domain-containing protein [Shimia ponticola]